MRDYLANASKFLLGSGALKKAPDPFFYDFFFPPQVFIFKTSIFLVPFFYYSNQSPVCTAWSCTTRNAILVYRRPVFQHSWVRPHYAESTTSRLICEVKQRQAQLVLRWAITRESWVLYSFFCAAIFCLPSLPRPWPMAGNYPSPFFEPHRVRVPLKLLSRYFFQNPYKISSSLLFWHEAFGLGP